MNKATRDRIRAKANAAYDELDDEVAKMKEEMDLEDALRLSEQARKKAQPDSSASQPDSVKASKRTKDVVKPKGKSKGKSSIKRYDDGSVTKTTTSPSTVRGRKGTQTTTVSSGETRMGKSDNPEVQKAHDWFKMKNKYGDLIRKHGLENIRKQVKGSADSTKFNEAFPPRKKKKK
jgi:hypothetical protein